MEIKWDKLKTVIGYASHIPEALNLLTSEYKIEREKAYWQIDNYVVCQSDLYESAFYVINPLLNLLEDKFFKGKSEALDLLYEISRGNSPEIVKIENVEIGLQYACKKELIINLERIKNIYVYSDKDIETLNDLIENIKELQNAGYI